MAKKKELKRKLRLNEALLKHALWCVEDIKRDFEKAVGKPWEEWASEYYSDDDALEDMVDALKATEPQDNFQPTSSLLEDVKQEPTEDTSKYFEGAPDWAEWYVVSSYGRALWVDDEEPDLVDNATWYFSCLAEYADAPVSDGPLTPPFKIKRTRKENPSEEGRGHKGIEIL